MTICSNVLVWLIISVLTAFILAKFVQPNFDFISNMGLEFIAALIGLIGLVITHMFTEIHES